MRVNTRHILRSLLLVIVQELCESRGGRPGLSVHPPLISRTWLLWTLNNMVRAQKLCKSRGGRPGLPVPNNRYGLCGRKATLEGWVLNQCSGAVWKLRWPSNKATLEEGAWRVVGAIGGTLWYTHLEMKMSRVHRGFDWLLSKAAPVMDLYTCTAPYICLTGKIIMNSPPPPQQCTEHSS